MVKRFWAAGAARGEFRGGKGVGDAPPLRTTGPQVRAALKMAEKSTMRMQVTFSDVARRSPFFYRPNEVTFVE